MCIFLIFPFAFSYLIQLRTPQGPPVQLKCLPIRPQLLLQLPLRLAVIKNPEVVQVQEAEDTTREVVQGLFPRMSTNLRVRQRSLRRSQENVCDRVTALITFSDCVLVENGRGRGRGRGGERGGGRGGRRPFDRHSQTGKTYVGLSYIAKAVVDILR